MSPFRLVFLLGFLLSAIVTNAQDCYTIVRQKGIDQYNAKKYDVAIKTWKAAKDCSPLPKSNDLDTWIKKANDKLIPPDPVVKPTTPKLQPPNKKPTTVNPGISAAEQKKREADETAWKYALRLKTKEAYELYLEDHAQGKYANEARQKIKELTPPVVTNPVITRQPYEPEMIKVTGSTFTMGCKDGRDTDCYDWEKPAHSVTLKDFSIGKYEVTQAQWRAVMGSDPPELYFESCDQCPVENVSWNDVQEFTKKLNAKTGKKYRLPTEAEWEYAARGGNQSDGYLYAGSNTLSYVSWYSENAESKTHPVGQKSANELGIHDMSGNVWEWCSDWYSDSYYAQQGNSSNPTGAATGSDRVLRGGSWGNSARYCRAADRDDDPPTDRNGFIGFRLAL